MQARDLIAPVLTTNPGIAAAAPFLVLGAKRPFIPGLDLGGTLGAPIAEIILSDTVAPSELQDALDRVADPAVPIADLGNNIGLRRDIVGEKIISAVDIKQRFEPIWQKLAEIPFTAEHGNAAELTILRLAYSRKTSIVASFVPGSQRLVEYELLGFASGVRAQLEAMTTFGLLRRRHFTRTHLCQSCGSARQHVFEACSRCGGADLTEEPLVHHYRCGCNEVESHFVRGELLVCPKCNRVLHHLGVDYGKPGTALSCGTCQGVESDPTVRFACLDCSSVASSEDAKMLDWFHYDITDDGVRAIQIGRLPQFDIERFLRQRNNTFAAHEFSLLVAQEIKASEQFNRPFAAARLTCANFDELLHELGPVAVESGTRRLVDVMYREMRPCDFIGMAASRSMIIAFPGTSAKEAASILEKVRRAIDANAKTPIEIEVEVAEGDTIQDLLVTR